MSGRRRTDATGEEVDGDGGGGDLESGAWGSRWPAL
jgi:hypothetical protein